jgi:hypothetical protein
MPPFGSHGIRVGDFRAWYSRRHGDSALHRISLMSWLQISGPSFATLDALAERLGSS